MEPRIAVVVAEFNRSISEAMVEAATDEIARGGAQLARVVRVPGCYEIPFAVALQLDQADAVVALGFIERGETLHGEVMGHVVHRSLVEQSLQARRPIGIGIIGPGATDAQAEVRKEGHARAAVRAALATWRLTQR